MNKQRLLEIIKKLRKENKWTHEQMAGRVGWSKQVYEKFENGRTQTMDFDAIEQIAQALDMTYLELINYDSPKEAATKLLTEAMQHFQEGQKKIAKAQAILGSKDEQK